MARRRTSSKTFCRAFTMIEILVVIAIISFLAVALVVGSQHAIAAMREKRTKATLGAMRAATDSAEGAGLFRQQPIGAWIGGTWTGGPTTAGPKVFRDKATGEMLMDPTTHRMADFWRAPDRSVNVPQGSEMPGVLSPGTNPAVPGSSGAPVSFKDDVVSNAAAIYPPWLTDDAIRNTAIALVMIHNIPAAAASIDPLPDADKKIPTYWSSTTAYSAGARVLYIDPSIDPNGAKVYVALKSLAPGAVTAPTGTTADTNWKASYGSILDAWGNPMIFVPACGLKVNLGGSLTTVKSTNGKPFWASAGADGDFFKGDDNLYSFDN